MIDLTLSLLFSHMFVHIAACIWSFLNVLTTQDSIGWAYYVVTHSYGGVSLGSAHFGAVLENSVQVFGWACALSCRRHILSLHGLAEYFGIFRFFLKDCVIKQLTLYMSAARF